MYQQAIVNVNLGTTWSRKVPRYLTVWYSAAAANVFRWSPQLSFITIGGMLLNDWGMTSCHYVPRFLAKFERFDGAVTDGTGFVY